MLVYGKCECFVMQMLCFVCILWQVSMLHDLQFVNAGRGCKKATIWKRHTPEPVS